jgi:hypothetical protein
MTQAVTADVAWPKSSSTGNTKRVLAMVKAWLWASALATAAGWSLSALGQLNRVGYLVFGAVVVAGFVVGRKAFGWEVPGIGVNCRKLRRRFRRWLPASFAVLTFLVFLGGVLYPPSNHAGFTYRTPRVLHWLMEGHWHWIHTPDYRMNDRACGFEWLTAPVLLFTKSDRSLFLINFLSFLFLPGLIFSVFTRLGVRPRVAWHWMWLLPTGYNFLLQAGSTANDTFPTVYALAAMDFGLRAWASRRASDLWLSVLAAALLTGAKASNLTLLLPWAIVVCPLLPLLLRKPVASAGLLVLSAAVSFLPTAALNQYYCGDWSGLRLEREGMNMKNPLVGVWGNALLLLKNLVPPFFPLAGRWNQSALTAMPQAVVKPMVANFEQGFHVIGEIPTEDGAGLGFGVSVLILVSVVAGWRERQVAAGRNTLNGLNRLKGLNGLSGNGVPKLVRRLALIAPWGSLLFYGMKSGIVDAPRLISPYYALLLPSLIVGARQTQIVRRRWWRALAWGGLVLAVPVVMTIPGRPLWPAQTILSKLKARKPGQTSIARALEVYTVYGDRWDSLAQVRPLLPAGLNVVGFLGHGDDVDISLWRPFFSRRVEHILLEDSPALIRERGLQYAVVSGGYLATSGVPLEAWLQRSRAELLGTVTVIQTVIHGPQPWYVVRFK